MPRTVIHAEALPMAVPLIPTLVAALALDHWHAPGWLWGAVGLLYVFVWIIFLYDVCTRRNVKVDLDQLPRKKET